MNEQDYLLMPLWAPIQSWGDQVVTGDDRPTLPFPTHSGLCGLIAAALGIPRPAPSDHETRKVLTDLHRSLNFIILDICPGSVQTDFYAVNGFVRAEGLKVAPKGTIIGRKTYMSNKAFLVAAYLEKKETAFSLDTMGQALLNPHFPIYAGRKSYPFALPPVYHVSGKPELVRWKNPFLEMIELRQTEEKSFQALYYKRTFSDEERKETKDFLKENEKKSLFKGQRLPHFSNDQGSYFYCDHFEFQKKGTPYSVRDRYRPSPLKARIFEERIVYSISIQEVKQHYAVSK